MLAKIIAEIDLFNTVQKENWSDKAETFVRDRIDINYSD